MRYYNKGSVKQFQSKLGAYGAEYEAEKRGK